MRQLSIQLPVSWKTRPSPQMSAGSFYLTFQTPLTMLTVGPCSRKFPSLAAWMECCYGSQPLLHLGDDTILSCCGVQQGGPLGFSLTLQPIVERIKDEVPNLLLNAWYLDDGTLCGSLSDVAAALKIIEDEGPSRGLHLNRSKSLLFIPGASDASSNPLPPEIPISRSGFSLLGCPLGPPSFCEETLLKRVEKVKLSLSHLSDLADAQMETTLLRSCLALPKISFALRTCPPNYIRHAIDLFDKTLRDSLEDLAGSPLSDWAWLKASLPSNRGGLNIRRASLHAPAAFLGSLQQTSSLVERILGHLPDTSLHLQCSVDALAAAADCPDWVSLEEIDVPLHQRAFSISIDDASQCRLLASAPDTRSRALAQSTALPHSGDWLNVVPSPALGLRLQDKEFRLCLKYWLGLPLYEDYSICSECLRPADPFGDHQMGCGGNGDRIHRHDSIRDVLFAAALAPRKEVPALISGSGCRPADVYLPNWLGGRPAALDVSVISPLQQRTLFEAANTPGHAVQVGINRKMTSHSSACQSVGVNFIPLIVESLGGWSSEAISTVRAMGCLQGQRLGTPPSESTRHLFQRLAVALCRGNACLWIRRQPTLPPVVGGLE